MAAAPSEKAAAEERGKAGRDPRFTGDPQIDWEFDPNLPRELQGFNMTGYPFFSRVPPKMTFSCKDRIDGFYANTDYKCQVRGRDRSQVRGRDRTGGTCGLVRRDTGNWEGVKDGKVSRQI